MRGRRTRPPEQVVRNIIEHAVTRAFGVTGPEVWRLTRGNPHAALARQVGMYLAHVAFELSLTEVGVLFVRDRTTVAHACSVVEDRRDDPGFDRVLDLMEGAVRLLDPRRAGARTTASGGAGPPLT
ncbi:MAG: helix-turn-helix domain-containing protein [Hyphomicrobiaceae bacterium]|nr:helix-turn-helix domain-containing protein [Hyphomicrobiaceae bacterium]